MNYFVFVSNHLKDVQNDKELQDWVNDVAVEGIGWQNGTTKDFPTHLSTKEELVSCCASTFLCEPLSSCSRLVKHILINFLRPHVRKHMLTIVMQFVLMTLSRNNLATLH